MLKITNLTFKYKNKTILQDINLNISCGDFVGVIGPNGAGKTTLLRLMSGWHKPCSGFVYFNQKNLNDYSKKDLASKIAIMFSEPQTAIPFKVEEFVAMARYPFQDSFNKITDLDRLLIEDAMALTDIIDIKNRLVSNLSSGERQRVFLAQCLAQEPVLMLLDEPTSHLDIGHEINILHLLQKINKEKNITIIMVIHDLNMAERFCDKIALLKHSRVFDFGETGQVMSDGNILQVFGVAVSRCHEKNNIAHRFTQINTD